MRQRLTFEEQRIYSLWGWHGLENKSFYSKVINKADEIKFIEGRRTSWEDCVERAIDYTKSQGYEPVSRKLDY